MTTDPRTQFIIDTITAVGAEIKPDAKLSAPDDEVIEAVNAGLKIFDRLLPMIVGQIRAECKQQEAQEKHDA